MPSPNNVEAAIRAVLPVQLKHCARRGRLSPPPGAHVLIAMIALVAHALAGNAARAAVLVGFGF